MGMFDTVDLNCPRCRASIEIKTKAGDCLLRHYDLDDLPPVIAEALDGKRVYCAACPWNGVATHYTKAIHVIRLD